MISVIRYLFIFIFTFSSMAASTSKTCRAQSKIIKEQHKIARNSIKEMISDVQSLLESQYLEDFERLRLRHARNVLKCTYKRSRRIRYICNESNDDTLAYTIKWIGNKIWLTKSFIDFSNGSQAGLIVHELTHKCGTNDEDYFWNYPPRDVNNKSWSSIADTYRWWHEFGVCLPGLDC